MSRCPQESKALLAGSDIHSRPEAQQVPQPKPRSTGPGPGQSLVQPSPCRAPNTQAHQRLERRNPTEQAEPTPETQGREVKQTG